MTLGGPRLQGPTVVCLQNATIILTPMSTTTGHGFERLERATAGLQRHGTLQRLHEHVAAQAGVDCERAVYLVLRRVAGEGPMRVTEVARDLGVEPSTASRHLQCLETKGWVTRLADPEDRRAALVAATPAGEDAVRKVETERRAVLAGALKDWEPADRERLFDLTERFYADLSEYVLQLA